MKKTVLAATFAFCCFIISVVIVGNLLPPEDSGAPAVVAQTPQTKPPPEKQYTQYTLKEVARHATEKDCWMAIGGKVYDFSAYIPQHPSAPEVMLKHCGKEATHAFETKDVGRPHSNYAKGLLPKYLLGTFRE